jgi:histidine phosphotransfer protein HptB
VTQSKLSCPQSDVIYSRLGTDLDLGEIVTLFVEEMPARTDTLRAKFQSADWEGLARSAHQLKGAAGSYGFDEISPCAGRLEAALEQNEPEAVIRATVKELLDLCSRVRAGGPE